MKRPTCPAHPAVRLVCPACNGAKGGGATGPKKRAAAIAAATARWAKPAAIRREKDAQR